MRKTIFGSILILTMISAALSVLFFAPATAATASPDPDPLSHEKQDFSRGRKGYKVSSDFTSVNATRSPVATDQYGYNLSLVSPIWKNHQTATEILFDTRDDDAYGPVQIGFEFPFYENSFSELYVSTNGMISFGGKNDAFENRDIPRDTRPNNFIAPFWDDLLFSVDETTSEPISRAYYRNGKDAQGDYFVIEWYKVARLDSQEDTLTFQVILRPYGDILFQYQQLNGTLDQATVGIEDGQGVDGSIYLYNFDGLDTSDAVLFNYPVSSSHRAKIYPINQGSFVADDIADLQFTVRNTGDLGTDTFDLKLSSHDPSWEVSFFDADGMLLGDSNNNGTIDTGPLTEGQDMLIALQVKSPTSALVGENINPTLSAVSSQDPNKQAQATFNVAVPTAFAQALQNGTVMRLHLAWRENQISALAAPEQFFGSNLAVQRLVNGNYFYSWERNAPPVSAVTYADLRFTILSDLGGILLDEKSLTDHSNVSERTEDRYLVSSVNAKENLLGLIWVRSIYRVFGSGEDAETRTNQNIFFAILDERGKVIVPARNLTQNTDWRGKDETGVPYYNSPRISSTGKDRFILAWVKDIEQSGGKVSDIEYMVYDTAGSQLKSATLLTNSQPAGVYYIAPTIEELKDELVLLSYSKIDPDPIKSTSNLVFQTLDSGGVVQTGQTPIDGSTGATTHDSILIGGAVLLAWPSAQSGEVGFTLLDAENAAVIAAAKYMTSPNLRDAVSVSVARDDSGRGIITWVDRNQNQYLYYTLVSDDGTQLTPEMIYLTAKGFSTLNTNGYGYGLASYEGTWQASIPLVVR